MGSLDELERPLHERLAQLEHERVIQRLWAKDHTLWKPDPTEISNRLGWLDVHQRMRGETGRLNALAEACADYERIVLLGMGGSSLGPEVLSKTFGGKPLIVLDTTHPVEIIEVERSGDLERTLFIVASKSGTTIETTSQLAYFFDKIPNGVQFVAITDAGTPLEATARSLGFRDVFLNPPDIGGRYSVLSYFGLVPAALIGVDVGTLLDSALEMSEACKISAAADNPGARLGAAIGEAALQSRNKLTLCLPDEMASFGAWLEQLIAESTGKEGKGIVPVVGEPSGQRNVYRYDRLFVAMGYEVALKPSISLPFVDRANLGGEFFRWEFATAIAGHVIGINPFDQPNVEEAKQAAKRYLESAAAAAVPFEGLEALKGSVKPGDYIAIQAYVPRTAANEATLQDVRMALRDSVRVATTLGYGPRFLHSAGQLHKGGPSTGVFIQVVDEPGVDLPVPGKPYTFRMLLDAQANGDYQALKERGRRVIRMISSPLEEE